MNRLPVGLCWGTLWNAGLEDLITVAARHGFPTIAATPPRYRSYLAEGGSPERLQRLIADAGIAVGVIDPLISGLPGLPALAEIVPQFRNAFDFGEDLAFEMAEVCRAPIVNVAHFLGKPVPLDEFADAIRGICERAAPRGLSISLEFIPGTGMPDLVTAEAIRNEARSPNLGILFDTWHYARSGGTLDQLRALPVGSIHAAQLSDRVLPPRGAAYVPMAGRSLPGEGEQDLASIVGVLLDRHPGLSFELEVFNDELRSLDADAAAQRVAEAVRRWSAAGGSALLRGI